MEGLAVFANAVANDAFKNIERKVASQRWRTYAGFGPAFRVNSVAIGTSHQACGYFHAIAAKSRDHIAAPRCTGLEQIATTFGTESRAGYNREHGEKQLHGSSLTWT
jgi:hypothetical protein